jgi:methionyl-tRNA formyltransferase
VSRLAVFSLVPWAFQTVRDWAARADHEIKLLVTFPANAQGPGGGLITLAGADTTVMIVPSTAACEAALRALDVDLGVVFTFRRVPESVAAIPRRGVVNLHPSLLPAYRGPNGLRSLFDGAPRLGATLHHLTPEFDAGPILAQASEATPEDVDPASALEALKRAAAEALDAGVPRALAGEPGEEQDPSAAPAATEFTDQERVLDLTLTAHLFQCRFSALSLAAKQPTVMLDEAPHALRAIRRLPGVTAGGPGVIRLASRRAIVATADHVLELELGELPFLA